ncbi:MAG: helix-turn-helix transcriptional regulator, partial [Planctomycetes bacterium]|nr:helix-turn-helix transcriptional regulator [Planctomycetota bacterium]
MDERPLVKPLPAGVPTYGSGHGRVVWAADDAPVQQLFNDWVVYWIPQGEASWELKDGRTLHGVANGFAILPPLVAATLTAVRRPLVLWNCHVAFRTPTTPVSAALRDDVLGPGESAPVPLAFSAADAPGVLRAYRDLTLISLETMKAPWQLERAVLALVSELAAFARSRSHAHGRLLQAAMQEDQRLVAMLRRIDEDPAHPWRVADLARSLGVTTHRMHAMCRSSHGTSLKAYIVRARMNLAVRLLRQVDGDAQLSLKQVSERCGFSSQHFFSRQFRSVFQVSPSAYRKGESLGERSAGGTDWGEPVLRLPASDWQRDWQIRQGDFTLVDGRMVAGGNEGNCLVTTRKMWGDTAIEFDGLIPEHLPATDISV